MGVLKVLAMVVVTLLLYPFYFVGWLLLCWHQNLAYRFRAYMIGRWAAAWCWILGMRITQIGQAPARPFIMVSNHLGYLDILLLVRVVPAWFISKADVRGWPVIGWMCRSGHTLFINRELLRDLTRMNAMIAEKLDKGQAILFFPEGTSTRGAEVQRFKPSLLEIAAERNMPVHMVVLSYESEAGDPPPSETICWWGDMGFGEHFSKLLKVKRFRAHLEFLPEPISAPERKQLGEALRNKIAEHFAPNL